MGNIAGGSRTQPGKGVSIKRRKSAATITIATPFSGVVLVRYTACERQILTLCLRAANFIPGTDIFEVVCSRKHGSKFRRDYSMRPATNRPEAHPLCFGSAGPINMVACAFARYSNIAVEHVLKYPTPISYSCIGV